MKRGQNAEERWGRREGARQPLLVVGGGQGSSDIAEGRGEFL